MQNSQFFEYLQALIDGGNKAHDDLNAFEEDKLTALFIRENPDRSGFLADDVKYDEIIEELLQLMCRMTSDPDGAHEIVCQMVDIANDRFNDEISQIFAEEVTKRQHALNYERGMKKSYDEQTGEVRWHK